MATQFISNKTTIKTPVSVGPEDGGESVCYKWNDFGRDKRLF
jgi:hypothetical protein